MNRPLALFCILGVLTAALLGLLVLPPGAAAQEPQPRPSPTPQPYIQLTPNQAVAGENLRVLVTGMCWPSPGSIRLHWERLDGPPLLPGPMEVEPDGSFAAEILIPAAWATPGSHFVFAAHSAGQIVAATLSFAAPTATDTPTPTDTPVPTDTDVPPTPSRTPTSTPTSSPTLTPTPSRTMRPVTPDVTSTPRPAATPRPVTATTRPGGLVPTGTEAPTETPTATATPTASATSRFLAMVSATAVEEGATATDTPTATDTASPTASPTRTPEATPANPPVPRETRDPGQQLSQVATTPRSAAMVEGSLVEAGLPQAGSRWESGFALGFIAAVILLALLIILVLLVLVTLLVTWRIMRMRRTGRAA